LGLVANVMATNAHLAALSASCRPSSSEVTWVNNMVREYAKAGGPRPTDITLCGAAGESGAFKLFVEGDSGKSLCYEIFAGTSHAGMIWAGYPMASEACRCKPRGECGTSCKDTDREYKSNIYEVFATVESYFSEADFLANEASTLATFRRKAEECAPGRLAAQRQSMWTNLALGAAGSLGQRQGVPSTMESVGAIMGASAGGGGIGGAALQFAPLLLMGGMQ
jgi:hypothetical protein